MIELSDLMKTPGRLRSDRDQPCIGGDNRTRHDVAQSPHAPLLADLVASVVGQALGAPGDIVHVGERVAVEGEADQSVRQKVERQVAQGGPALSRHGSGDHQGHENDRSNQQGGLIERIRVKSKSKERNDRQRRCRVPRHA